MAVISIRKGEIFIFNGRRVLVEQVIDINKVRVIDLSTGSSLEVPISELLSYSSKDELKDEPLEPVPFDEASKKSKYWEVAKFRYEVIEPLLQSERSKKLVEERAKEFNLSTATLYRWLKTYENSGRSLSSLLPDYHKRGGQNKTRLPDTVEDLMDEVIKSVYLNPTKRVSIKRTYLVLKTRCKELGLKCPCLNTLKKRINSINPYLKAKSRLGRQIANSTYNLKGESFEVSYPLEVVQIDHTLLDVIVVDPSGEPIGRPFLTLAMDVYSRMIYGYYLSFEKPNYFSVAQAIFMGIMPKDSLLKEYGVEGNWEVFGLPTKIHVDNAKEFHSQHLERFCQEYNIILEYRQVRTPHYGGHVERLFRTINKEIHNLRGATFSNPKEKGEYDPEKHAVFTLLELEKWLLNFIVNIYHKRYHAELETTPEEKYRMGILGDGKMLGVGLPRTIVGKEAERIRLSLLPSIEKTIQKDGVHAFSLRYFDPVLRPFIRVSGAKSEKYVFKYDPRDLRFLYFQHPTTGEYYKIPCRNRRLPKIARAELKYLRKKLSIKKRYSEEAVIEGYQKLMEIEEKAESKKWKRRMNSAVVESIREKIESSLVEPTKLNRKEEGTEDQTKKVSKFDFEDVKPFTVYYPEDE